MHTHLALILQNQEVKEDVKGKREEEKFLPPTAFNFLSTTFRKLHKKKN